MATHSSILAWRIPTDRGAWRATIHGVEKSQTWLSHKAQHTHEQRKRNSVKEELVFLFLKWMTLTSTVGGRAEHVGILIPQPGIEPSPPHWKCRALTTGLPGKSQYWLLESLLFGCKWININATVYKVSIFTTHWQLCHLQLFKVIMEYFRCQLKMYKGEIHFQNSFREKGQDLWLFEQQPISVE